MGSWSSRAAVRWSQFNEGQQCGRMVLHHCGRLLRVQGMDLILSLIQVAILRRAALGWLESEFVPSTVVASPAIKQCIEQGWDTLRLFPRDAICAHPGVDAAIQCVYRLMKEHQITLELIVGVHVIAPIHDVEPINTKPCPSNPVAAQNSARYAHVPTHAC